MFYAVVIVERNWCRSIASRMDTRRRSEIAGYNVNSVEDPIPAEEAVAFVSVTTSTFLRHHYYLADCLIGLQ